MRPATADRNNGKGIFVSYQYYERGCIKCNIFLISKGNTINFSYIIVDYMGKQHVGNEKEIPHHY